METSESERTGERDLILLGAAWIAGIAAAVASYSALYQLALLTGWNHWTAPLFPATVDAYAIAAIRVWLGRRTASPAARGKARRNAVLAIAASMAGNAALHAALAHDFRVTWPVVVTVAAVPPVTLGLVMHLIALRGQPAAVYATASVQPELAAAGGDQAPEEEPAAELEPLTEPDPAELAAMTKAQAIRIALRHTDGAAIAAQEWLAARGIKVDRSYVHDVREGRSGRRRQRRDGPMTIAPAPAAQKELAGAGAR